MVGNGCLSDLIGNPEKPERSRHCKVESCTIVSLG